MTAKKKPNPKMLGSGAANKAAKALRGRKSRIEAALNGNNKKKKTKK